MGAREPRVERLLLVSPPPALLAERELSRFRGPILILTGAADALAAPAELGALAAAHAAAQLVVIPEADHFFRAGLAEISREAARWLGPPAD